MKPYFRDDAVQIYLGDCRTILPTLAPVDLVLTDPPYNSGKNFGDGTDDSRPDYAEWLNGIFAQLGQVAKEGSFCISHNRITNIPLAFNPPSPWRYLHLAVWHKPLSLAGTWYRIAPHWEPIFIWVKGAKPWCPFRNEQVFSDVFGANVQVNRLGHPTEKPLDLTHDLIEFGCPASGTILDPFMGSGTTLRAAKDLGRKAIGIEIEERYCEIAAKRMSQQVMPI